MLQGSTDAPRRSATRQRLAGGKALGFSRTASSACRAPSLTLIDRNSVRGQNRPAVASIHPRKTRTYNVITIGRGGPYDHPAQVDGVASHVPADCKFRSSQAIAPIEQLFDQDKTGSALPFSTAVRVVR